VQRGRGEDLLLRQWEGPP